MKWLRKSLLCASVGYFGATASGQEVNWRPTQPLTEVGVSLGRPTPLPGDPSARAIRVVNAFAPIQPRSSTPRPSVVRAASAILEDEPKSLILPRDLPPLVDPMQMPAASRPDSETQAVQAVQPPPKGTKVIEIDKASKIPAPPTLPSASGSAPFVRTEESAAVSENRPTCVEDHSLSFFGLHFAGEQRFYVRGEYLLWWTRGMHLPPLVTTASPTDPEATRAALGFGTTQILYGDSNTSSGPTSGARLTVGYNLDDCGLCALEGSYFFLGRKNDNAMFNSSQFPVLGRPFFDLNDGVQSRQLTTSPGINPGDLLKATGSISINTSSSLMGAELNLRSQLWVGCNYKITGLLGVRYLSLNEGLGITENALVLQDIPANPPNIAVRVGDQVTVFDRFNTRNQFFGGQVGVAGEWNLGRWFVEGGVKVALGATQQSVDIDGGQLYVSTDGRVQSFKGGLYAVPSNIGHAAQSQFGVVPELNLKLGYNLTDNIRVFVGYDFMYWSSVLRPGDQIDQTLDLNQVPNSGAPFPPASQVRPIVPFRTSSYWAHGVNAGVEFRY